MTMAMGNAADMEKAITTLNEIKESIINAYQRKTGLSRNKISKLMSDETWLNAKKAVELGFADEILFADNNNTKSSDDKPKVDDDDVDDADSADAADHSPDAAGDKASEEGISLEGGDGQSVASKAKSNKNAKNTFWGAEWQPYSTRAMGQAILNRLIPAVRDDAVSKEANSEAADTEAVLGAGLNATAEETPQEVQTQEEEAPSATTETTNSEANTEANTEASTVFDVSKVSSNSDTSVEPDIVTNDTTNAEEGQTEETQTETAQATDDAHDTVANTVASDTVATDTVATGDEQELGAEDSEPVNEATTNTASRASKVITNDLPDDVNVPEEPEALMTEEPKSITDEAKDTSKSEVRELTIGLDGKAKDGSMPYALLEKQLQLLR
ncbi:MAG: ATP-dependent Clp protease proteolytic subunit [Synergistaceae bacterium]|nr:ATP-dependent Clp protease proteolytic subunit [Synergistaceae bacterium]